MNRKCLQHICAVALAVASVGIYCESTRACVEPDAPVGPPPPPPDIWVQFHSPQSVWITFHGYRTFGSNAGQFCTCAINQVANIVAVNAVEFRNVNSGALISAFSFSSDPDSDFGGGTPWAGFASAALPIPVPGGTPVDILFDVTVAPGTTFANLSASLSAAGNVIGTDEANSNGAPAGTHQFVFPAGNIMNSPLQSIPTTSEWGLIVMTLLLLTAGTIVLGRRRSPAVA